MDDATLVSRAVGGDRDAFADIYDRYAGAVLDLCTAILRDAGEATEATLDSFLRAARELVNLKDRSRLRLWLLAVARYEAIARGVRRREEGLPDVATDVPAGADGNGDADDPRRLVWDPASALLGRDRAILHLSLRHELGGDDLAAVLGLRPAAAQSRATHLRELAESSVGALLLSRSEPGNDPMPCPKLAEVLAGWDGQFTPSVGARIDRHARRCDVCRGRRTMLLGRLKAMASLPFVPAPPWLRDEVLLRMELAVSSRLLPGWGADGFPPGIGNRAATAVKAAKETRPPREHRAGRGKGAIAVAAVLVVLGVSVSGFLLTRDKDDGSTLAASGASPTTVRTVPATTTAPAPATTRAPAATVPATTTAPAPATTTAPVTTAAPAPPPTAPPVTADVDPPGISFGADAASAYVYGCPYSRTAVTAEVTDRSQITWVALFVVRPDGVEESVNMAPDGGRWTASIGDFDTPGQAVFWVEASDARGNRSRAADQTLAVSACS